MIDKYVYASLNPITSIITKGLTKTFIRPNHITLLGFACGLVAVYMVTQSNFLLALMFFGFNRILDGLDGALARLLGTPSTGGMLDIICDFTFYSFFSISFILVNPAQNALAGVLLAAAIQANATAFLCFAIMQEQHKNKLTLQNLGIHKAFYYVNGVIEGTETVLFLTLMCLFSSYFPIIAFTFAALCFISAFTRTAILLHLPTPSQLNTSL